MDRKIADRTRPILIKLFPSHGRIAGKEKEMIQYTGKRLGTTGYLVAVGMAVIR